MEKELHIKRVVLVFHKCWWSFSAFVLSHVYRKWMAMVLYNNNNNNENYNEFVLENNNEDDEDSEDDNINYDAIYKSQLTQDGKAKMVGQLKALNYTTTCLQKLF